MEAAVLRLLVAAIVTIVVIAPIIFAEVSLSQTLQLRSILGL